MGESVSWAPVRSSNIFSCSSNLPLFQRDLNQGSLLFMWCGQPCCNDCQFCSWFEVHTHNLENCGDYLLCTKLIACGYIINKSKGVKNEQHVDDKFRLFLLPEDASQRLFFVKWPFVHHATKRKDIG